MCSRKRKILVWGVLVGAMLGGWVGLGAAEDALEEPIPEQTLRDLLYEVRGLKAELVTVRLERRSGEIRRLHGNLHELRERRSRVAEFEEQLRHLSSGSLEGIAQPTAEQRQQLELFRSEMVSQRTEDSESEETRLLDELAIMETDRSRLEEERARLERLLTPIHDQD